MIGGGNFQLKNNERRKKDGNSNMSYNWIISFFNSDFKLNKGRKKRRK